MIVYLDNLMNVYSFNFAVYIKVMFFVQGLLKVAVDNARVQEKQVQQERKELKMELYREREMRESLERQLTSELHSRGT